MDKLNYYSGRFIGLFKRKDEISKGKINFHTIKWDYVKITDITACTDVNLEELKAGAFYYTPLLKARITKWEKTTGRNTSIFIPKQENQVYSRDFENFLVRDIDLDSTNIPKLKRISSELYQIDGTAYFSVPSTIEPIEKPVLDAGTGDGKNVFGNIYIPQNTAFIQGIFTNLYKRQPNQSVVTNTSTSNSGGCLSILFKFFVGFIIGALLYYLWHTDKTLFWGLSVITFIWLLGQFLRNGFWAKIGAWGLFLFLIFYLQSNQNIIKSDLIPQETKDGSIKVYPPVEDTDNSDPNVKDYSNKKQLNWWDFLNKSYKIIYSTSSVFYRESAVNRERSISKNIKDEVEYYSNIYNRLNNFDDKYLDSFLISIQNQRLRNKLNVPQTAEMVVTMIQEIPYVLVHDMSCEQLIQSSKDDFIQNYHEEKKPCLPNIAAGVQSPYEFIHNLKGDCDTRALLGFAILKKLRIPASVWISNAYGHSVLGVGIPTQGNTYKIVEGVKHFPVELTAKGFRLGMIAPNQRNMNNWNIAIFNN